MTCQKCGSQIGDSTKFCTVCGAPVDGVAPASQGASALNQGGGAVKDKRDFVQKIVTIAGVVCVVFGILCFSMFSGMSKDTVRKESQKLLRQIISENEVMGKIAKVERIFNCTLLEKSKNQYKGFATASLKKKKDAGVRVQLKYNMDVTVDGDEILVEAKISEDDLPKAMKFIEGSEAELEELELEELDGD